jgi:hypothetical protein
MQVVARKKSHASEVRASFLTTRTSANVLLNEAFSQLHAWIDAARSLQNRPKIAFYGQSVLASYLVESGLLGSNQVAFMIEDNPLCHGQVWRQVSPIISLETFLSHSEALPILLTMNRCYHDRILPRLSEQEVWGPWPMMHRA